MNGWLELLTTLLAYNHLLACWTGVIRIYTNNHNNKEVIMIYKYKGPTHPPTNLTVISFPLPRWQVPYLPLQQQPTAQKPV